MIAGFSVLSLALDAQTDIVKTQRIVSDIEIKKQQEEFGISASTYGNNILNMSINNQGQNPVEISSIWITNKTLPDKPATRYEINYDDAYVPSGFKTNVLLTQPLEIVPDTYDIKVISAFGTIKTIEFALGSVGSSGLRAEIIADPPDVIIGQNVTIAMLVTNTGDKPVNDVRPDPLVFATTGSGTFTGSPANPIPAYADLNGGASVLFTWDYQVVGVSGEELTFSSIARGNAGEVSGMVSDISILREPTDGGSGGGGEGEEVVIKDELFGRPDLFLTFPSPLGWNDGGRALWGVNVANPTDQPIKVSRVVIVAMPTASTSGAASFAELCEDKGNYQAPVSISPPSTPPPYKWTCPAGNQLQWEDMTNPQEIAPRSVFPFLVRIGSGNIATPSFDASNLPITASVFSTLGQFGKSGYMTTMVEKSVALPNVFLSTDEGTADPDNIITEIRGITEGDSVTFNATIADMDTDPSYFIHSGTKLIINIPKDWTYTGINSYDGFVFPVIENNFPDGSTQLIGTLEFNIDGVTDDAKTIQFTATAPEVSAVGKAKMYVMHILGDGSARGEESHDYSIGAVAENVLQICDASGCPT